MDKYMISVGTFNGSKNWKKELISFEDLCARLSSTIRTPETVMEYKQFSREERDKTKDKGGFVGGELSGKQRLKKDILYRSILTFDVDSAKLDFLEKYKSRTKYKTFIYTTHSHRPDAPRLRLIVPLTRNIDAEEFNAVSRYYANEWGIDQFDKFSFMIHQLMYYPTTPKDGEFISLVTKGDILNPDIYLEDYPNWRDLSSLPTTPDEKRLFPSNGKKQEDPCNKSGIVGAFCRAYDIPSAIDVFLPDVYEGNDDNTRYTFKKGTTSWGAINYHDKFLYSFHSTDPASGLLCNSFDLVRVHLFGGLDEKESFKEMTKFASEDAKVKEQIIVDRTFEASDEFKAVEEGNNWLSKLKFKPRTNEIDNKAQNLILILENDPDFRSIKYNEFANLVEVTGDVPWHRPIGNKYWRDADTNQLITLIEKRYGTFSQRICDMSFGKVTDDRSFHPIREFLDNLPKWDGVKRVERLFIDSFGADDNDYVKAVTRKTFTACVARVMNPGVKFDAMLVLDGKQGIGKSTIIQFLTGKDYFSDSLTLTDMSDKTAPEKLQGFWIVEIGELAGMKKADIERVKSFLSCRDDKYRPSFGHHVESHPRQSVIIATVNGERGYLRDITGNRRFWILKLHKEETSWAWEQTEEFRLQFWAECLDMYKNGEELYLSGAVLEKAEEEQKNAMEVDERVGIVEEYLEKKLPSNWNEMDLFSRRNYLDGDMLSSEGAVVRDTVSNIEIWSECFKKNPSEMKASDSYAISALMIKLGGWERTKTPRTLYIYGSQRVYKRK